MCIFFLGNIHRLNNKELVSTTNDIMPINHDQENRRSIYMDPETKMKITELRESTGMNRREFCEYFKIPYRTVTEWERDNRHAPDYVIRLLEYYIRMEGLAKVADASAKEDERAE